MTSHALHSGQHFQPHFDQLSTSREEYLSPPSKKRKTVSPPDGNTSQHKTPTKRLPSCDLCRARKVKCVKSTQIKGLARDERCEGCVGLNQACEYTHERRKPGPANGFARKPSPPRHTYHRPPYVPSSHSSYSLIAGNSHSSHPLPPTSGTSNGLGIYPDANRSTSHDPRLAGPTFSPEIPFDVSDPFGINLGRPSSSWTGNENAPSLLPVDLPFLPISPSTLLYPMPGEIESSDGSPAGPWPWDNASSGWDASDLPGTGLNFSVGGWDPPAFPTQATSSAQAERPSSAGDTPRNSSFGKHLASIRPQKDSKVQHLEEVMEWSTMMRILHAYHAHLYPLMPIVHWPSFSQQLIAREDEKSDVWRAFILSLVAYSIIQLPRSSLTFIPVPDLRRIHQKCHSESRKLQNRRYTTVSLIDVTTLYCQHIYLGTLGRANAANVTLAEAIRLSQVLSLQDDRADICALDVVEREVRRRTFWLLYGSDRTITALTQDPMYIYDSDLCLPLPLSLDDNLLTPSGAFPQPPNTTPVLAGFHYNTRLFRLLGAVLTSHRNLAASWRESTTNTSHMLSLPPPLSVWVRPASHYLDELEAILLDLPGPLQLVKPVKGEPATNGSTGSETPSKDAAAFATCRANLLVTQALVRFAIRQYAQSVGQDDIGDNGKDWAEKDVLGLLEAMSPESLAANGDSLRAKVFFVASSLLEKYPSTTEGHSYVSDFLNVYTRISQEQHISLLEAAPSGEVSRAHSPSEDELS